MRTPQDRFLYWIEERESIRLKRKAGEPKPWTDDPILRSYRFCNVRRMDDRVSQWLLENWYEPNYGHENMVTACALARFINLPESLEAVGFPYTWQPSRAKRVLHELDRVFNTAYIISTTGVTGSKIDAVIDNRISNLHGLEVPTDSLESACEVLQTIPGVAWFMAGQISSDLRWATGGSWRDRKTWAPPGPGSKRGLNRLLGLPVKTAMSNGKFHAEFAGVLRLVKHELPKIDKRLEAIDVQNCLCEFDKYERTLHQEGIPKRKYKGV